MRSLKTFTKRHLSVVFVDAAVAPPPIVKPARGDPQPQDEELDGGFCLAGPAVDEIDDLVSGVVRNPASFQS